MSDIAANLAAVQKRIAAAAHRSGRQPEVITLVAVTKTHPLETVIEAYEAGVRHFGENRMPEAQEKAEQMAHWLAAGPEREQPTWHYIGHIQSRQVGDVIGQAALIHSLDSLKLARRINRLAERDNLPAVNVLIQCNVSGETSKYGFELSHWAEDEPLLTDFVETVAQIAALERLVIRGVMTMAPFVDDPQATRPVFQNLAGLRTRLRQLCPDLDWGHLSMGMTNDYEVAIEEGATIVRVGRAIFGERNY